jgi:hypothetical protein
MEKAKHIYNQVCIIKDILNKVMQNQMMQLQYFQMAVIIVDKYQTQDW